MEKKMCAKDKCGQQQLSNTIVKMNLSCLILEENEEHFSLKSYNQRLNNCDDRLKSQLSDGSIRLRLVKPQNVACDIFNFLK